jgi:hypothetical protein
MSDRHCEDCDRPELCDVIAPGTAPCKRNEGYTRVEPTEGLTAREAQIAREAFCAGSAFMYQGWRRARGDRIPSGWDEKTEAARRYPGPQPVALPEQMLSADFIDEAQIRWARHTTKELARYIERATMAEIAHKFILEPRE